MLLCFQKITTTTCIEEKNPNITSSLQQLLLETVPQTVNLLNNAEFHELVK